MSRDTLGMGLSAIGGAVFAWGVVGTVGGATPGICVGSSFEACGVSTTHIGATVVGMLLFMVAAFLAPLRAWFTGPVVGLAVAALLLVRGGTEINSSTLGSGVFIAFCVLLGPAILMVMRSRQKRRQKIAANLVATGSKGVAQVQGAQQTGVYINERPQLQVSYMIHPLDGSPAFPHTKKQLVDYGGIQPQPGLTWPCWYDPADPSTVAVGAPNGYTQETLQLLQEFNIPAEQAFGYDPGAGVNLSAAPQSTLPPLG